MISALLNILRPVPHQLSCQFQEHELVQIEVIAIRYNLWQLFYSQLQKHYKNEHAVNRYLKEKENRYRNGMARSMQNEHIGNSMVSLFMGEGIPACLIKGSDIARKVYLDPNCRVSGDIDILIREEYIFDADRILKDKGYCRGDSIPLAFWLKRLHHAQYFHEDQKHCVEIHWNFTYPNFFELSSYDIWKEIACDDSGRLGLSPSMMVILSFMHHYRHVFMDIRTLVDILWTLHRYDNEIDWLEFMETCRKIGMLKTVQIALNQIYQVWPETSATLRSAKILNDGTPQMGDIVSRYFSSKLQNIGLADNKGTVIDSFLNRFTLDSWTTSVKSIFATVIPSPRVIKVLYNEECNWRLASNYLRFISWRLREWMGQQH